MKRNHKTSSHFLNKLEKIAEAKAVLEENGYVVARRCFGPGWQENAVRLGDNWVAFRLQRKNKGQLQWITPRDFCEIIGIDRHTLTRHLKDKDCPRVKKKRGRKGRLVWLQPTQELITFLRKNKRSS